MRIALLTLAALALSACFDERMAGGGGIETTDGQIAAAGGGTVPAARLRLVPEGWNPMANATFPESLTAHSGSTGKFAFSAVPPGRYNLEGHASGDGTRLFRPGLVVKAGGGALPNAALSRPGRLRLHWEGSHRGWLFIRGTTILRRILPSEIEAAAILLDSLPAGMLPQVRWSQTLADTAGTPLTDSVRIASDSVTDISVFPEWKHAGVWRIRTAAAGVAGDVADFPALVRLASPGFDFSRAQADGADLRFADSSGTELAHQIERWDAKAGRAEIWVRMPVVRGGDSAFAFRMHWGNPGAGSHSSGPDVFGPSRFAAAWHLSEPANTRPGGYRDAGPEGLHGTASALIEPVPTEGAIAGALRLDGSKRVMVPDAPILDIGDVISVSAWFNAALWQGGNRRMVQKGIGMTQYALAGYGADSVEWRLVLNGAQYSLRYPAPPLGEWHHILGTYDGRKSILYLDGEPAATGEITGSIGLATDSLAIGFAPSGPDTQHYQGLLDEVTVSPLARTADWVRLAYRNQAPGSTILRFAPER